MEGMISGKKRYLLASCALSWSILYIYPAKWLALPLSTISVACFLVALMIYGHNEKIKENTKKLIVISPDSNNWNATIRLDRIEDPEYRCKYRVYFTVSRDEIETIQDGNVTTYTGDKVRVQEDGIREVELYCAWIGKNGDDIDSNIWRNKFATVIKRTYKGRISVLSCGYLRQEHI